MPLWPCDTFFQSPSESELQAKMAAIEDFQLHSLKPARLVPKNSVYHRTWNPKETVKLPFLVLEKGGVLSEIRRCDLVLSYTCVLRF